MLSRMGAGFRKEVSGTRIPSSAVITEESTMKIFEFDPATGTRGKMIRETRCVSYTRNYSMEACKLPKCQGEDWAVHEDAGFLGRGAKEVSLRCDQWVCMCAGLQYRDGIHHPGTWVWVVLPPLREA